MELFSRFKKYLINTVPTIVVKFRKQSLVGETLEKTRSADRYICAMLEQDSYHTYPKFTKTALMAAGFIEDDAIKMSVDKTLIPIPKHEDVVKAQRKEIIKNYIEKNDYYRMLNGLPDLDKPDQYIEVPDFICDKYNIKHGSYLHEVEHDILNLLESDGVLAQFISQYPDLKYLSYMGVRKIDIVTARLADNFELLYAPRFESDVFFKEFIERYDEAREYFLTVVYNVHFSTMYEYYDSFIGLCILTMCIQRMITNTFKLLNSRDFYDVETIRLFMESYNVPYVSSFNMSQMRLLVKNLNILLREKSTDKVLFDVLNLLGYNDFHIMKYYLCKQHRLDNSGNPIFIYDTVTDEQGNTSIVKNNEAMFELYFKPVDIGKHDIQSALHDTSTGTEEYEKFIQDDELWINDADLLNQLYESDINYVNTKYMTINIMYKMYKMIFEVSYVCRMIKDKKAETANIKFNLFKLSPNPISIFDLVIFLICLMCKRMDMKPTLFTSPSQIITFTGFNFDADISAIIADVKNNPKLYNQDILSCLKGLSFKTVEDVNNFYFNIRNLNDILVEGMSSTDNIKVYNAYKKLYNTLLNVQLNNSLYKMQDGTIPEGYDDYLQEHNATLYKIYKNVKDNDIVECVEYCIAKLSEQLKNTQYLSYINSIDNFFIEGILKMLRFFKSYTIDIKGMEIVYIMDSKYHNMVKLIDDINKMSCGLTLDDYSFRICSKDVLFKLRASLKDKESIKFINRCILKCYMLEKDKLQFSDIISNQDPIEASFMINFIMEFKEVLKSDIKIILDDDINIDDDCDMMSIIREFEDFKLLDRSETSQDLIINRILNIIDICFSNVVKIKPSDSIKIIDTYRFKWEDN